MTRVGLFVLFLIALAVAVRFCRLKGTVRCSAVLYQTRERIAISSFMKTGEIGHLNRLQANKNGPFSFFLVILLIWQFGLN